MLATLVGQGGTLPYVIKKLGVRDDGAAENEERVALGMTARAALERIDELDRTHAFPHDILELHRLRLEARWEEFRSEQTDPAAARRTALYRQAQCELLDTQRRRLIELGNQGKIDNTVLRRVQRVLDLQTIEVQLLGTTGHADVEE